MSNKQSNITRITKLHNSFTNYNDPNLYDYFIICEQYQLTSIHGLNNLNEERIDNLTKDLAKYYHL